VDTELEELKRTLRSKNVALDDVVPIMQRAARALDRLQSENLALLVELNKYQAVNDQLLMLKNAVSTLSSHPATELSAHAYKHLMATIDRLDTMS
jgi:hypothetical protein